MNQFVSDQKKVAIETHGCKLNQADSQALAKEFAAAGFQVVSPNERVDIFVLNSCTVTHVADRKARHSIRSARRRSPDATIVATGCYAERNPTELQEINEIDLVMGNASKRIIVQNLVDSLGLPIVSCAIGEDIDVLPLSLNRNRAMVKIQEGCDQVCSYCIVPKVRGREKSVPVDQIVSQVAAYQKAGYREVVLTGTQLGSYGFDLDGESISSLISHLLSRTAMPRIRVSSLQPQDISAGLIELWDDPRMCPHFHVPLQSGSDDVLKRMRRRYTGSRHRQAVDAIRNRVKGVAITADVIVGFPGETDAD
ncbi:MAG: MiaB/RimO family radical SAM methylthiotransferase, partial [SAR202 cluster bacterium]|nr:MiaB/RimO family radical SAM methylthiotransferase [SAR202 cluster bacterium]